uniref:hypothetical protein n=1 Tax=Phocaeicola vulgatus TaxID=821 RepID=UPI004027DF8E
QQLCCKGICLPFFPRGLTISLSIGNVPAAVGCFSVIIRKLVSQNLVRRFMCYRKIPASSASVCCKGGINHNVSRHKYFKKLCPIPKGCCEATSLENR